VLPGWTPPSLGRTITPEMRKRILLAILIVATGVLAGCWRQETPVGDIATKPSPAEGPRPLQVEFDGSGFAVQGAKEYRWDFGYDDATATGQVVTHTFAERGTYQVQLTVVDEHSRTFTAETEVLVRSKLPVAVFSMDPSYRTVVSPRTVYFDASESYHPDDREIVEYQWDFGDGNTDKTEQPTTSNRYVVQDFRTREFAIELRVKDNEGNLSSPVTRRIEVRPGCPSCG